MESPLSFAKQPYCTLKSVAKFCLLYFSTLLVLTLIFVALNHEPMTEQQTSWWWAFLITLLISASLTVTSLLILIYTDFYRLPEDVPDIEQSKKMLPDRENSASFKTVLTINSLPDQLSVKRLTPYPTLEAQTEKSEKVVVDPATDKLKNNFVNMTPDKSPVTVVDVRAINAKKKSQSRIEQRKEKLTPTGSKAEDANLATLPSKTKRETEDKKRDKKTKKPKDKDKKKRRN